MNFESLLGRLRRQHLEAAGRTARRAARPSALKVESLEAREVPAVLPAPIIDYTTTQGIARDNTGSPNTGDTINIINYQDGTANFTINGAISPTIVANPLDARKLFGVVKMLGVGNVSRIGIISSTDGGDNWSQPSVINNGLDPTATPATFGTPTKFTQVGAPTPVFDRFNNVFLAYTEQNAAGTSGRVVLRKFNFTGGAPGEVSMSPVSNHAVQSQRGMGVGSERVMYQWANTDAAYNVTVAIDNNLASFLDDSADAQADLGVTVAGIAKRTQSDALAASQTTAATTKVFVAWNTFEVAGNVGLGGTFTQSKIRMAASPDGGNNFTPQVTVNDSQFTNEEFTAPKIIFSPGRVGVAGSGGQMVTMFSGDALNRLYADSYDFNLVAGPALELPVAVEQHNTAMKQIDDAFIVTVLNVGDFHVPVSTEYKITVPAASFDPTFVLGKLAVTLSAYHNDLSQIRIDLVAPGSGNALSANPTLNSPDPTINPARLSEVLVWNRVNRDNNVIHNGIAGTALGRLSTDGNNNAFNVGTTFEDNAERRIDEGSNGFAGSFRPENGTLFGAFGGMNFAALTAGGGTWSIIVTDYRDDGTGILNPVPQFGGVTLKMSQNFKDGLGFSAGEFDKTVTGVDPITGATIIRTVTPNSFTGASHPTANAAKPGGVGTSLTLAADATLGAYSPYQGRVYASYFSGTTQVIYSDDAGKTWSNNVAAPGGFNPQIAVDQTTGTVLVSSYSSSADPSLIKQRSLTVLSTAINGPAFGDKTGKLEFSAPAPVNPKDETFDEITRKTLDVEYVSSNGPAMGGPSGNTEGFGTGIGLAAAGGKVQLVYAGNLNRAVAQLRTQEMTITAGPRVVKSDSGVILGVATLANKIDGSTQTYNFVDPVTGATFTGFYVEFDRAVRYNQGAAETLPTNPLWFTKDDILVRYRAPGLDSTNAGDLVDVLDPIPLDGFRDPINNDVNGKANLYGAKRFFVPLVTPQTRAGTYSFVVGNYADAGGTFGATADSNGIADRIRYLDRTTPANPGPTLSMATIGLLASGSQMDQNGDAVRNVSGDDTFAVPASTINNPFVAPFKSQSLPVILPGPHVVASQVHDLTVAVNDKPITIVDQAGAVTTPSVSTIKITEAASTDIVQKLTVTVNVTHGNVGELGLTLTSPGGRVVKLVSQGTLSGANLTNTTFADAAAVGVAVGTTPYTGTFLPVEPLTAFKGSAVDGTWTLTVTDTVAGTVAGTIDNWSLSVQRVSLAANGNIAVSNTTAKAITDRVGATITPTTSTIDITGAAVTDLVKSLTVTVNVTHGNVGDLGLTLTSPDGRVVKLVSQGTLSGADLTNTTFDDTAFVGIAAGSAPYTGSFVPAEPLTSFNLGAVNGTWTLTVTDSVAGTAGTLDNWSLAIKRQTAAADLMYNKVANAIDVRFDRVMNTATVSTADALRLIGPAGDLPLSGLAVFPITDLGGVAVAPATANSKFYRITFPDRPIPGQYQVQLGSDIAAQVAVITDRAGAVITPTTSMIAVASPVSVPNDNIIQDVSVKVNITHAIVADLALSLTSPGGQTVRLVRQGDATSANFTDTIFAKAGTQTVAAAGAAAPYTATYLPVDAMGGFDTFAVNGNWTLTVTDGVTGVQGTLNDWALTITTASGRSISTAAAAKMDKDTNAGVNVLLGTAPGGLVIPTSTGGDGVIEQAYGGAVSLSVPADAVPRFLLLDINGPTDGYQIQKLTATITAAVAAGRTLRDLEITLVSPKNVVPVTPSNPNGTVSVVLMKDAPRTGPDTTITNVTFTDDPATPVQSGIAAAGGKNNPVDVLANFLSLGILAKGKWNLQVINRGTAAATISKFALTLDKPVLRVGLGDTVADQSSLGFRVFYSDELAATGNKDWVPVGPDGNTQGATTNGRVSSVAVDPSDASGNTVYAAGASGGLWRTTNFLTRDVKGPTWVPLTDFGPNQEVNGKTGSAINVGSITVINETGDPLQSKIIVGTGSAALNIIDTQQQPADRLRFNGVGFLYSEDAGKTWNVLDSTKNYAVPTGSPPNTAPKFLPVADVQRDHLFVGAVVNKVVAEKKIVQNSDLNILYAAVGAGATPAADQVAGLWRSLDSGRTWQQIYRDANGNDVTDFVIGEGSAQQDPGGSGSGSFLHPTIGYVAVEGVGVLTTSNLNAQAGVQFNLINGGVGRPTISQFNPVGPPEGSVPVGASLLPNGSKARIVLAAPSFQSGNTFANNYYQGWLVAAVSGAGGNFDGLYITKDQGLNWTRVRLTGTKGTNGFGLNAYGFADTAPDLEQALSVQTLSGGGADHSLSIAMDPTDPNIVYVAGFNNIRVDLTQVNDPYKLQLYSHTDATGNPMTTTSDSNTAGVGGGGLSALDATRSFIPLTSTTPIDDAYDDSLRGTDNIPPLTLPLRRRWNFLNLKYDPYTPFDQDTTLITSALTGFTNNGNDAPWAFTPTDDEYAASIVTYVDPVTGKARVIFTHDDGISTFVANPDGTSDPQDGFNQLNQNLGGGTNLVVGGTRNGNIQVARFYSGDVQPSKTAADIANAMFYGASRKVGDVYTGAADLMDTGDQSWSEIGRAGRTNYVTTDPGGSGTVYILRRINNIGLGTDFFQIQQAGSTPISRTFGLFIGDAALGYTATDDAQGVGQWRNDVRRFAVNPIDKLAITMGSSVGRLFSTVDQGRGWFVSAQPSELDGTYVGAVAYGAPGSQSAGVNAYLYAGTAGGKIYVKTGNSLAPQWKNISANLDGSPIQKIVANPLRGSNSAYAVTDNGVYYMADWASANVALNKWKNISGNLFAITHQAFGLGADYETTLLQRLSTIAVDWRPLNFFTPGTPVLYAGGDGGVYRSLDNGNSWNRFTDATTNGLSEGGGLPNVKVTDLDLAIGDVIQNTGRNNPAAAALPNQLVATTLGRGSWAIELITPNDQPIIDPITDVTVLEDSAQKTVNLTGISPG